MATQNLDLESQEQLDQLKYFWSKYGTLITAAIVAVALIVLGGQYYQKMQRDQALQAGVIYADMEKAHAARDGEKLERAFEDLKAQFPKTVYTEQAALLAAQVLELAKPAESKAALKWLADNGKQPSYVAIARLRLAAFALQAKNYDEALQYLSSGIPSDFAALAADRRGDIYMAQDKKAEAKAEYLKAYADMPETQSYRGLIEIKLNALGVDAKAEKPPAANAKAAAPSAAASAKV